MKAKLFSFGLMLMLAGGLPAAYAGCYEYSAPVVAFESCGVYDVYSYSNGSYNPYYYAFDVDNGTIYEDQNYNEYRYPPSVYAPESVTYGY